MQAQIVMPTAAYMSSNEWARLTGQTPRAVEEQLKNKQIPAYPMPPSERQKDPKSTRRKLFVDVHLMHLESIKRAGLDPIIGSKY